MKGAPKHREAKLDEQGCSQCGAPWCRWAMKLASTRSVASKAEGQNADTRSFDRQRFDNDSTGDRPGEEGKLELTEEQALAALSFDLEDDEIPF